MQNLAATPQDSRERFEARRLLPGMAKRIREVRSTFWQIPQPPVLSAPHLQLSKPMLSARVLSLHGLPALPKHESEPALAAQEPVLSARVVSLHAFPAMSCFRCRDENEPGITRQN